MMIPESRLCNNILHCILIQACMMLLLVLPQPARALPAMARTDRITADFRKSLLNTSTDDLILKAMNYFDQYPSKPDSAFVCYMVVTSRGLEKSSYRKDLYNIARTYHNLSVLSAEYYLDYSLAYNYLLKAKEIAEKNGFTDILPYIYFNLNNQISNSVRLHTTQNSEATKLASEYQEKSIEQAVRQKDWKILFFSLLNYYEKNIDDSTGMKDFLKLCTLPPDSSIYSRTFGYLKDAVLNFQSNDYDSAAVLFRKGMDSYSPDTYGAFEVRAQMLYSLSLANRRAGRTALADSQLDTLINDVERHNSAPLSLWLYETLSDDLMQRGDTAAAEAYLLKYYRTKEKLADIGNVDGYDDLIFKAEVENFREELTEASVRHRNGIILIAAISIVALAIIAILVVIVINQKKRRDYIMKLYEKNKRLVEADTLGHSIISKNEETDDEDTAASDHAGQDSGAETDSLEISGSQTEEPVLLDAERTEQLRAKIVNVLEDPEAIYNPDFQLNVLCQNIGSNSRYVSYVINTVWGTSFRQLITGLRIKEACRLLSDPQTASKYTVEGICVRVGFKSRTAFSLAFKKQTGLSPTEYRRACLSSGK